MRTLISTFPNRLAIALPLIWASAAATADSQDVYLGRRDGGAQRSYDDIDHGAWNRLLGHYVDADGQVDYRAFNAPVNRQALDRYLGILSTASPKRKASRAATLAFWINAYNAVTIRGILREYPTTSIRNHTARFVGYNIWKNLKLYVGGTAYSLEDIEHKILRKMKEPRIHFAIVCASKGCPRLLAEAYTAKQLEQQLTANAKDFFQRRQNFRYDAQRQRFYLSSILKWFSEDFGANQQAVLKRIAVWLPPAAQAAASRGKGSVSYLSYDWSLNEQES